MHSLSLFPPKVSPALFQLGLGEFEFIRASRSGCTIYIKSFTKHEGSFLDSE